MHTECLTRWEAMANELVTTVMERELRYSAIWKVVDPPSMMMVSPERT